MFLKTPTIRDFTQQCLQIHCIVEICQPPQHSINLIKLPSWVPINRCSMQDTIPGLIDWIRFFLALFDSDCNCGLLPYNAYAISISAIQVRVCVCMCLRVHESSITSMHRDTSWPYTLQQTVSAINCSTASALPRDCFHVLQLVCNAKKYFK